MIKEVMYNNMSVKLHLKDLDVLKKEVITYFDDILDEMEEDYSEYYPLYETEEFSTKESVLSEKDKILEKLDKMYNDDTSWEEVLKNISVKKNGRFRKNGVSKFIIVESATDYFTDYTNAWNTLVIQLSALNENEVEMIVKTETFTY